MSIAGKVQLTVAYYRPPGFGVNTQDSCVRASFLDPEGKVHHFYQDNLFNRYANLRAVKRQFITFYEGAYGSTPDIEIINGDQY